MQRAEEPTAELPSPATARSGQGRVSVALLAAVACVPIVVAAGFLTDRRVDGAAPAVAAVPGDISVLALRGGLDASAARRPDLPVRAGY